jgi:hypothetical protein
MEKMLLLESLLGASAVLSSLTLGCMPGLPPQKAGSLPILMQDNVKIKEQYFCHNIDILIGFNFYFE